MIIVSVVLYIITIIRPGQAALPHNRFRHWRPISQSSAHTGETREFLFQFDILLTKFSFNWTTFLLPRNVNWEWEVELISTPRPRLVEERERYRWAAVRSGHVVLSSFQRRETDVERSSRGGCSVWRTPRQDNCLVKSRNSEVQLSAVWYLGRNYLFKTLCDQCIPCNSFI